MERQWQEMCNSRSPRPATDHCQRTPWRSWCHITGRTFTWTTRPYTSPGHPQMGTWSYCREMPTAKLLQGRIGQRKRTAEEPAWHPWDSWEARVSQQQRWSAAQLPWDGCWWQWAWTTQLKSETNHCRATYGILDCGASRATCDSCFCRASARTRWFAYSPIRKDYIKRVRFQVEQKGYHTRSGCLSKPPHWSDV